MRRITFLAASIVSVLVIAYGGWASSADAGDSGHGEGTTHTGKPGEAPKR